MIFRETEMNSKKKIIIKKEILLAVACSAMLTFSGTYTVMKLHDLKIFKEFQLLAEAENLIDKHFYYDASDKDLLVDSAVSGYVSALDDPYSRYQSVKETEERNDSHAGLKIGIGITVELLDDGYMRIFEVTEKSPSEKGVNRNGEKHLR